MSVEVRACEDPGHIREAHFHLKVQIQPGWRVYAAAPPEAEQKVAGFSAGYPPGLEPDGGTHLNPLWPRPELWTRQDGSETLSSWVYRSSFDLPVQTKSLAGGVQGILKVLACSDTLCIPLELPFFVPGQKQTGFFVWWMLGMAFLGGLVLHLMPCVLPVLGLKLAQMVHAAPGQNRAWNGGAFLGVMTLFSSAGVLWGALKWGGSTLGWGFHFQNLWFVLVLFVGLLALWTHGMGWWTWKTPSWVTRDSGESSPLLQGALHGTLVTLLATPCTAPFLGTALGVTLAQGSPGQVMLAFVCMGLGFSVPYMLLMFVPPQRLPVPKPGPWMQYLKSLVSWSLFGLLLFLGFVLWQGASQGSARSALPPGWEAFSTERLDSWKKQRPVLVRVTAAWCVTCHVNERVWRNEELQKLFQARNILLVHGDITRPDPEVDALIRSHQRAGIPFAVLYTPDHPEGVVFPELLSVKSVKELVQQVTGDGLSGTDPPTGWGDGPSGAVPPG